MKLDSHNQQHKHMPIKCATVYQNRIWISCYLYNALYCYDYVDNNMEYLGKFDNQNMRDNLHRQIVRCGDKLFFIPICADGIDVYNIKEHCFEDTIKYGNDEKITNRIALSFSDEVVWLFPQNVKEQLYVLHTKEKKVEILFEWKREIDRLFSNDDTFLISASGICTDENNIYVTIYNKGTILQINRKTLKIRKIFFDEDYHFASIKCLGGMLYLTETGSADVVQIKDNKVINIIKNEKVNGVEIPYCGMVDVKNGLLVIPHHLNEFYLLDTESKTLKKTNIHFSKKDNSEPCFLNWQIHEGDVILYPARAQSILAVSCQNLAVRAIELKVPDDITNQWTLKNKFETYYTFGNGILREPAFNLEEFIMLVEEERSIATNSAENIGDKIYTTVNEI